MNERIEQLPVHPLQELELLRDEMLVAGATVFDFGTGDPGEPVPESVREALREAVPATARQAGGGGARALRRAAAEHLYRRYGVTVDPEREVLPTMGSTEALFHLPMLFAQVPSDKDLVLYGEPAKPVYELGALFAEAWTYAVPLGPANGWQMDPDLVPESVLRRAAVVFLNSPHDPTGAVLSDEVLQAWVRAREQYEFVLVNDEGQADLGRGAVRPRSLLEFGRRGCLVAHSLGERAGIGNWRSGFVAGDAALVARARRFRTGMGIAPPDFLADAAAVAWRDDQRVGARAEQLVQKRELVAAALAVRGLRCTKGIGLYLWAELPQGVTDREYAARCREVGILVAPGSWFGKAQQRFVRIALGPTLEQCRAAVAAWPH